MKNKETKNLNFILNNYMEFPQSKLDDWDLIIETFATIEKYKILDNGSINYIRQFFIKNNLIKKNMSNNLLITTNLNNIRILKELKPSYIKVLFNLLKRLDNIKYDKNIIKLNGNKKAEIINELSLSRSTIDKSLQQLNEIGIIKYLGKCKYYVNAYYFAKGDIEFICDLHKNNKKIYEPFMENKLRKKEEENEIIEISFEDDDDLDLDLDSLFDDVDFSK